MSGRAISMSSQDGPMSRPEKVVRALRLADLEIQSARNATVFDHAASSRASAPTTCVRSTEVPCNLGDDEGHVFASQSEQGFSESPRVGNTIASLTNTMQAYALQSELALWAEQCVHDEPAVLQLQIEHLETKAALLATSLKQSLSSRESGTIRTSLPVLVSRWRKRAQ